jgi:hypothetical protein
MRYRNLILGLIVLIIVVIINLPKESLEAQIGNKKLIKYGWDAPTPTFFHKHIKDMDKLPFDGVMLKLNAGKDVFKKTSYPTTAFTQDQKDLVATKSTQLTDNFILMWSGMDENWNWFNDEDWAAAERNIRNFAKTASVGRFRGIAFDSEPYVGDTWKYNKQPLRSQKTFQEYQKQIRKRGSQFIKIIQTTNPNAQILTFGLMSWMKDFLVYPAFSPQLQEKLADNIYGLWPDFVNGMLDSSKPDSVMIDGNERAYYFTNSAKFDSSRNFIFKDLKPFVDQKNRKKYEKSVKLGQAIYPDLVLDTFPNTTKDPRYGKTMQHFLSSDDRLKLLEHNVYHALRTADRYAWTYNESGDWWKGQFSTDTGLAIKRAKQKIEKRQPLGFNINPAIEKALENCKRINQANPAICAPAN